MHAHTICYAKEWWRPVGVKQTIEETVQYGIGCGMALYCMVEVKRKYCLHVMVKHGVTAGNIYSGLNPDASTLNNKCFPFFPQFCFCVPVSIVKYCCLEI